MTQIKIFKIAALAICFLSGNIFAMQIPWQISVSSPISASIPELTQGFDERLSYEDSDVEYQKVDVNAKDPQGRNALMLAAYNGQSQIVELLLTNGAKLENKDNEGRTALMIAAYNNHNDVIYVLLQAGAKIDTQNKLGWTALMLATAQGYVTTVRFLLEQQANADLISEDGKRALDIAIYKKQTEIAKLLRENALMTAAYNGCIDKIIVLLQKGININASNSSGWTALMLATKQGHVKTVEFLLKNKAEAGLVNKEGKRALDIAIYENNSAIVELLERSW